MTEQVQGSPGAVTGTTIGVVGTGNMGSALVRGWVRASLPGVRLLVWDKIPSAMARVGECEGVLVAGSPAQLAGEADFVMVVVKPKDAVEVLGSLAPLLRDDQVIVSAMAGVELARIRQLAGPGPAVFRVMPNLGVELGVGSIAVAGEPGGSVLAGRRVADLFVPLGLTVAVPESMLDAVTAVSGTGPALLALALEGLEDGGVAAGLGRPVARMFARRGMLGAARMLVAGDTSASELQERLAPPGDPLHDGVELLEERQVRRAFQEAVEAASERARQMRAPH